MIRATILYYLIAVFILFRDRLALHADSGWLQHFFYPLAHANLLHWALNGISLLSMATIIRWPRTLWAYAFSVLVGYIYQPSIPLLGISTIIYFYLGLLFVHINWTRRFSVIIVAIAGLFIPNIAAVTHILMLVCGILSEFIRLNWNRYDYR